MTEEKLIEIFKEEEDEFLEFDKVATKFSKRSDLHAFILLDKLIPGDRHIVAAAEHDEIWLDISLEDLAKVVTPEQVIELIRSGVRLDTHLGGLAMYA
jgi:hypothetical protein